VKHSHFNPGRLTFGCPACVERVKLDQDVAAASELATPPRPPFGGKQVEKCCRAASAAARDEEEYWEWFDAWANSGVTTARVDAYDLALEHQGKRS